jgi:hypothetical protein
MSKQVEELEFDTTNGLGSTKVLPKFDTLIGEVGFIPCLNDDFHYGHRQNGSRHLDMLIYLNERFVKGAASVCRHLLKFFQRY